MRSAALLSALGCESPPFQLFSAGQPAHSPCSAGTCPIPCESAPPTVQCSITAIITAHQITATAVEVRLNLGFRFPFVNQNNIHLDSEVSVECNSTAEYYTWLESQVLCREGATNHCIAIAMNYIEEELTQVYTQLYTSETREVSFSPMQHRL